MPEIRGMIHLNSTLANYDFTLLAESAMCMVWSLIKLYIELKQWQLYIILYYIRYFSSQPTTQWHQAFLHWRLLQRSFCTFFQSLSCRQFTQGMFLFLKCLHKIWFKKLFKEIVLNFETMFEQWKTVLNFQLK